MGAPQRRTIDLDPVVDDAVTYTPRISGPAAFDFGRLRPGELATLALPIHNLTPHPAAIAVRCDGAPAITLRSAPRHLADSALIVLSLVAPAGASRGTLRIDLDWRDHRETITIPVLAQSHLDVDPTLADALPFRSRHARDAARARQLAAAEAALATCAPITNRTFDAQLATTRGAMTLVGTQQQLGIDRAARELVARAKALPLTAPWLDLAMTVLDLASARVADLVAKSIEGGLEVLAKTASRPALPDSTIVAIASSVRRGLAVGATRKSNRRPATSDPRLAFLELVRIGNSLHEHERPTLHAQSALAVGALRVIERTLRAEAGHASAAYYEATLRQWLSFLHAR
jgi:hypothetical protein